MPFKKVGRNKYKSPSGRTFTKPQVKMYYATGGFKDKGGGAGARSNIAGIKRGNRRR